MYLSEYTGFKIPSINGHKMISSLIQKNIILKDVRAKDGEITFRAKKNESKKIIAFFGEICYTYKTTGESGLLFLLKCFLKRKGLIAGILILCTVFGLINSRLNVIKVNGLKTVDYASIVRILDGAGVKKGVYTKNIDKKHLEYLITSSIDRVAFASVKISGMTLIVNIYEELPPPDLIDMTDDVPLTATKDGVVTRIITFQGTPVVKIGEAVRAGDMLIAPIENIGGIPIGLRAVGDVYAKVYYKGEVVFFKDRIVTVRTGNYKLASEVQICGLRIGNAPVSPYTIYDEEIELQYLSPLPVKITRHRYYELRAEKITSVFEDELQDLIKRAADKARAQLMDGAEISDEWYIIRNDAGGGKTVEYYYETEEKIS